MREFDYSKCPSCKSIIDNREYFLQLLENPCPVCGQRDEVREMWPRVDVIHYIQEGMFTSSDIERIGPVKLVLYCSIFDFLLEDFLANILAKRNVVPDIIDLLLDSNKRFPERLKLFKRLTEDSLNEILRENDFGDFVEQLRILREDRNIFVHSHFMINFPELINCFQVIESQMLPALVFLNNKYVSVS